MSIRPVWEFKTQEGDIGAVAEVTRPIESTLVKPGTGNVGVEEAISLNCGLLCFLEMFGQI